MADQTLKFIISLLDFLVPANREVDHIPPKSRLQRAWLWVRRLIFLIILVGSIFAIWRRL